MTWNPSLNLVELVQALPCATWLNLVGLGCDIIGALILFKHGLPSKVTPPGLEYISGEPSKADIDEFNRVRWWSRVGLGLLILGFILQGIGTFLSAEPAPPVWVLWHAGSIG